MTDLLEDNGEEFSELVAAQFSRVDLVGKPANGVPFLIMKQDASAGLLDPDYVRDLIAKAGPERSGREQVTMPNGITLSGSPAEVAAFIHKASQRAGDVAKAEMSAKSINDLPDSAFGYIEPGGKKDADGKTAPRSLRHFPLNDAAHVRNALSRAPQSPFGDKAMGKIKAAAREFNIDVAKAGMDMITDPDLDDGTDGLDPTVPFAEPDDDTDVPGDPADPGSPAWEAVDAATAQKWLSIAARMKNALSLLAEREMLEAAVADPDDAENAWDLEDACCAVDYVIGQLAVYAAGEQSEAELGAEMETIGKALDGFDAAPLDIAAGLVAVKKAGRVLSSANEAAIRGAVDSLQKVLASLPEAPVAKSKEGAVPAEQAAEVAKETSPDEQARDTGPVNAGGTTGLGEPRQTGPDGALPADGPQKTLPGDAPGRQVVKAALQVVVYDRAGRACMTDPESIRTSIAKADSGDDGDGKSKLQAVFDQNGDLIGVVDPDAIQPVAGAGAPQDASGDDGSEPQAGPAEAAAPDADSMEPQPSADAGIPADGVAKSGDQTDVITVTHDVLKSIAEQAARTALETQGAAHQEAVAKMAAGNAEQAEEIQALKARLEQVENTPAAPKVFANGQVPPAHQMRGQDQGARQVDVAKARERKAELYSADAPDQARIAKEMQQDAIDYLGAMHAGR